MPEARSQRFSHKMMRKDPQLTLIMPLRILREGLRLSRMQNRKLQCAIQTEDLLNMDEVAFLLIDELQSFGISVARANNSKHLIISQLPLSM